MILLHNGLDCGIIMAAVAEDRATQECDPSAVHGENE